MAVGAVDQQILTTEAMQTAKTQFSTCVTNYGDTLALVQKTVADLITNAWHGDKGPTAFDTLHQDWNTQTNGVVNIVQQIGTAVGLTGNVFSELDTSAATSSAKGFGG